MQQEDIKLTPVFNRLSLIDRFSLRSAVMATTITRIAREDTFRNRALFIPYALPIGIAMLPLPMLPGSNVIPLGVVAIGISSWAWLGLTESARRNREELKRDFSHAAMIENYKTMIEPNPKIPGEFNVKNGKIAWHVTKEMARDSWAATKHFVGVSPK